MARLFGPRASCHVTPKGDALLSMTVAGGGSDDVGYLTVTGGLELYQLRSLRTDIDAAITELEARAAGGCAMVGCSARQAPGEAHCELHTAELLAEQPVPEAAP